MLWIASFPRSGNTFLRNILYEVYGLESSTFHNETRYPVDKNYRDYPFVKTHLLPDQLIPKDPSIPAIYLVRDGRDALCSEAHHTKDFVHPHSHFIENLKAAIIAEKGCFFGGWSRNVLEWVERAAIIIRFEDLINCPMECVNRIRRLVELPEPRISKLPTFEALKHGIPKYGAGRDLPLSEAEKRETAKKWFRRGRIGAWKDEMPEELLDMFWSLHGEVMEMMGYTYDGEFRSDLNIDVDSTVIEKLDISIAEKENRRFRVLVEADKLSDPVDDGVKRYLVELLAGFIPVAENKRSRWQIDIYFNGRIWSITDLKNQIVRDFGSDPLTPEARQNETDRERVPDRTSGQGSKKPESLSPASEFKAPSKYTQVKEFIKKYIPAWMDRMLFYHKAMAYLNKSEEWVHGLTEWKRVAQKTIFLESYDLIHLTLPQHYPPFETINAKFVTTVHDLTTHYFPKTHTKMNVANAKRGLRFVKRKDSDIIAVSFSTRDDVLRDCNISPAKVHMVYEAADKQKFRCVKNREDTQKSRAKYNIPLDKPYLFCLSTLEPRKNVKNTIDAFISVLKDDSAIDLNLVVGGREGWGLNRAFETGHALSGRVIFAGFIDDKDLSCLYSEALAFCYVSFYEGFGLPALEAMCCGTPVIFGRNSSLIEVVGKGGLPADPYDVDDIKHKIEMLYYDHELRREKGIQALKESLKFSWRKTVIETLMVYEDIILRGNEKTCL